MLQNIIDRLKIREKDNPNTILSLKLDNVIFSKSFEDIIAILCKICYTVNM